MYRDLRDFLAKLEQEGQLVRIKDEILPEPTIREIGRAAVDLPNGPAVIIENIKGHPGKKVALNVHGSWANIGLMIGMDKDTSVRSFFASSYGTISQVKFIDKDKAPCHEVVIKDNINLVEMLPMFRINKWDAGMFFSKASVVTRDPDDAGNFDTQNVGTYRMQVMGKDLVGIQALGFHDIARHITHAEEQNKPLPIAYSASTRCSPYGRTPIN